MALYAIGDLHLSLNSNKSMEVFGPAWENYTERIRASLSQLTAEDVLVLAGDTSWGMNLEESVEDFRILEQFPCKKYLITSGSTKISSTLTVTDSVCFSDILPKHTCSEKLRITTYNFFFSITFLIREIDVISQYLQKQMCIRDRYNSALFSYKFMSFGHFSIAFS